MEVKPALDMYNLHVENKIQEKLGQYASSLDSLSRRLRELKRIFTCVKLH